MDPVLFMHCLSVGSETVSTLVLSRLPGDSNELPGRKNKASDECLAVLAARAHHLVAVQKIPTPGEPGRPPGSGSLAGGRGSL